MKSTRPVYILFIFYCGYIFYSCSTDSNPLKNKTDKHWEVEIIPCEDITFEWDSTVYQGNTNWPLNPDSGSIDSLADVLRDSDLAIAEMWSPNDIFICGAPVRKGLDIIVKLKAPDSLIYNYNFQENNGSYPFCCIRYWGHYKFTTN